MVSSNKISFKISSRTGFRPAGPGITVLFSLIAGLLLFTAPTAFASTTGGNCPTGANYMNSSGSLVTLASLGITNCFYFSKSAGSDGNSGTSESTPQAHLPGMPTYTGSISPSAGQAFILKGGDRWTASDFELHFPGNGTSSAHIYIGSDPAWFVGGSWTRPIFDCQSTQCGSRAQVQLTGNFQTIDNVELTGLRFITETQKGVEVTAVSDEVERCYIHGWSHDPGFNSSNDDGRGFSMGSNGGSAAMFHNNVVDGSDTTKDMMGGADDSDQVYNNVFNYVYNGVRGHHNDVHSNLISNIVLEGWPNADHANGISIFGTTTGTLMWVYNNIVENDSLASGSEVFWVNSNGDATGHTTYVFNNILYNVGRGIDTGDHPPASGGTIWMYNNTINSGGDHCFGNGESPARTTLNYANNHCINSSVVCDTTGVSCNNLGGNLAQTTAQAAANVSSHFDQYTTSETFVYSPVASTNSTVGAGTNLTSSCTGNVGALCSDTTYPNYDSVNHAVVMRTTINRPTGAVWDIGAYQYAPQSPAPNSPTGLTALVQ
jgi:hypothetical protein